MHAGGDKKTQRVVRATALAPEADGQVAERPVKRLQRPPTADIKHAPCSPQMERPSSANGSVAQRVAPPGTGCSRGHLRGGHRLEATSRTR